MSWRYLDRVEGIAIDNENTSAHHQLISLDKKNNRLQYTVFYEPLDKKRDICISDTFIDDMNVATPEAKEQRNRIMKQYNLFMKEIRPHGSSVGFQARKEAKALTFDIKFNQQFQFTDMSYRPTLGYMIKKMTYKDAGKLVHKDKNFKQIHDLAINMTPKRGKRLQEQKNGIVFEEVMNRIGVYVQSQKLPIDLVENMDCIFRKDNHYPRNVKEIERVNKMPLETWAEYCLRYHSVRQHSERNIINKDDIIQQSVIPTTASRVDIDHYNIMTTIETLLNGKSPFEPGITDAVINYKKHQMVWQRLGML